MGIRFMVFSCLDDGGTRLIDGLRPSELISKVVTSLKGVRLPLTLMLVSAWREWADQNVTMIHLG